MDILLGFKVSIDIFLRKAPLTYPEEPSLKVEEDEDMSVERLEQWTNPCFFRVYMGFFWGL